MKEDIRVLMSKAFNALPDNQTRLIEDEKFDQTTDRRITPDETETTIIQLRAKFNNVNR